MDVVELKYPVDVSTLMGSEGFGKGARVSEDCKPLHNSSIDCCSSSLRHKDETLIVNALGSSSWNKIPDAELSRHASQLPRCQIEELSEQHDNRGTSFPLPSSGADVVSTQRKAGKMPRSNGGCSKRARLGQLEDTMTTAGVDDVKDLNEKTQMLRQKNSSSSKRGDRRNMKAPMKMKFDSFSMKAGFGSFTVTGGNNFLGLYGLKSDTEDVTMLGEDISLNELLDGSYEYPVLGMDKGKKATNVTENFLHSAKKACSILPLQRVQPENVIDIDNSSNEKMPMHPPSSVSIAASCINGDKEEACFTDPSTCSKDSCSKPEMPANPPDFVLRQPKDILELLALPPPKDLDSLLLDATRPSSSTRNNSDTRSGKQIIRGASLPPFPWSNTYNGCRTNPDAVKLLSNKSMCHGRWVKIPDISSSPRAAAGSFINLESLAYDPSLIPSGSEFGNLVGSIAPSTSNLHLCEQGAPSLAANTKVVPQGYCPEEIAAAQTLCDIATKPLKQNPDEIIRWPKKPSQKSMKARKTKSIEKPEATPSSVLRSDKLVRSDMDHIFPSKKPKLSVVEKKKNLSRINGVRKGPITWSAPRSIRSSPGKLVRDSIVEIRNSSVDVANPTGKMHLPATVLDKPRNNQHKLRKLMTGISGRDKLD